VLWEAVQSHPDAAVAVVLLLDGLGIPLMPELSVLFAFSLRPTWGWAMGLVALVATMEVLAAALLWLLVGLLGLPRWAERLMGHYTRLLLVQDERLLLVNRVVPILPMAGAFVRVHDWRLGRSLLFIGIGSALKYGALVALAGAAYAFFSSDWALYVSLGLAAVFLGTSWGFALRARRRQARIEAASA